MAFWLSFPCHWRDPVPVKTGFLVFVDVWFGDSFLKFPYWVTFAALEKLEGVIPCGEGTIYLHVYTDKNEHIACRLIMDKCLGLAYG